MRRMPCLVGFACVLISQAIPTVSVAAAAPSRPVFQVDFAYPTADKPQSKIWFSHGRWWALLPRADSPSLWERSASGWREHRAIAAALQGTPGRADVWFDSDGATAVGVGQHSLAVFRVQARDAGATTWEPRKLATLASAAAPGAPLETATIARDGKGEWWVATTAQQRVLIWHSADAVNWDGPHALEAGVGADDICAVAAIQEGVGVIWSDQARDRVAFRVHHEGKSATEWEPAEIVAAGGNTADDHLNSALLADGTLVVVTKNSVDALGSAQLVLRVRQDSSWRNLPYAPRMAGAEPSRPILVAGAGGRDLLSAHTIYVGRGRPRIRDHIVAARVDLASPEVLQNEITIIAPDSGLASQVNDATGPKQPFPADAPWLVLASDQEGRVFEADVRTLIPGPD